MSESSYDFDLVVIGGGSGGIAAAREAAKLGAKVACCDYMKPSPQGSQYGIGGTCVNCGCIPKKLYHTAALHGENMATTNDFGWKVVPEDFKENKAKYSDWSVVRGKISQYIRSLNFKYRVALRKEKVQYYNAYAVFKDAHTLELDSGKSEEEKQTITSKFFIIATGGRPTYPNIPGAREYCITSDDIFHQQQDPGKTLVVGASYVALECAGFLHGLGRDTTIMVRSIVLRGFDRQCADGIKEHMQNHGIKFIESSVPEKVEKLPDGKLVVTYRNNKNDECGSETYDTVLLAVGRSPETSKIGLQDIGVTTNENGKILVNDEQQSSLPHIYGVGDIIDGGLELTPVAIQTGKLLAKRLFGGSTKKMDFRYVPTTVFTPLEYGCVGMTQEQAEKEIGRDNLVIYYKNVNVLEFQLTERKGEQNLLKLICDKSNDERVVGFHYLGEHAAEVTQGFALGVRMGARKEDFDDLIGIHPSRAESFTSLELGVTEDTGC